MEMRYWLLLVDEWWCCGWTIQARNSRLSPASALVSAKTVAPAPNPASSLVPSPAGYHTLTHCFDFRYLRI
jgi:hypothetical protein